MSATPPSSQPTPTGYTPTAPRPHQNGLALASLILGIVGFLINPLLIASILALIFGIIALRRAPALGRRNMAIVGIILAVVSAFVGIIVTAAIFGSIGRAAQSISEASQPAAVAPSDATQASSEASSAPSASAAASAQPSAFAKEATPAEYVSALAQAQIYSDNLHLSKDGIYDQLTSDAGGQFPKKAAQYALDHVNANYNKNALEQAKTYQDSLHLSRNQIHDQLTSEAGGKFTTKQADYALAHLPK